MKTKSIEKLLLGIDRESDKRKIERYGDSSTARWTIDQINRGLVRAPNDDSRSREWFQQLVAKRMAQFGYSRDIALTILMKEKRYGF
jgi:hypothetical protein